MKTLIILVSGRVQGVGYRYSAKRKAEQLGIKGTVQNMVSGDVEIHAQGENLPEFLAWCSKGPALSRVDDVSVAEIEHEPFSGFGII